MSLSSSMQIQLYINVIFFSNINRIAILYIGNRLNKFTQCCQTPRIPILSEIDDEHR